MNKPLKNLLESIISPESDWKISLLSRWQEVVGGLKTKVRLEKISDDTLVIGVYDSAWMQEIFMLSNVILQKVQKVVGKDKIKKIRFKLVDEKKLFQYINKSNPNNLDKIFKIEPKFKRALENIKDTQLQTALEKYLVQCLNNKI